MGTISCKAEDNFKQPEIIKEDEGKQMGNNENKRKKFIPKNKKPKILTNLNKKHIDKKENKSQNIKYKYLDNIINPKKKANSKENPKILYHNEIIRNISANKKRHTIINSNILRTNTLKNSKLDRNVLNNLGSKKIKKKINICNYNNFNSNLYDNLDEEDIIDNNDNEFEGNIHLLYSNIESKNQYQDLKEKLMKAKEDIVKIKNQINSSKDKNNINNENNKRINLSDDINEINTNDNNIIYEKINNNNNIKINKRKNSIINTKQNIIKHTKLQPEPNLQILEFNQKIKNEDKINNEKKKINNTIFINNSNVTISNDRTNIIENNFKDANNISFSNIKKNNNYSSNIDKSEINEILTSAFSSNNKEINKEKFNNKYFTVSDIDIDINSSNNNDFFNQVNIGQSQDNIKKFKKNIKNRKIINKLTEIKNKINNQNISSSRMTYPIYSRKSSKSRKNETMDNKQIKKNIPAYRHRNFEIKNFRHSTLKSSTYDKNKKKLDEKKVNIISLQNTFNKKLSKSLLKSKNNKKNKHSFKKKKDSKNDISNSSINKFPIKHSYLNSSSEINISEINVKTNKINKNQRLLNYILKNTINNENNEFNNINDYQNNNEKNNNLDQILIYENRDTVEIDISDININEYLINKEFLNTNINNIIFLNYDKLDSLNTSEILYDGIIYKVVDGKNNGFKITERYFQLLKNCFKYYNNIENSKINSDKPLLQFDIRHIKNLNIINNDIFKQYKLKGKNIEFSFSIFLYQNEDFFVFVVNNEKIGKTIFNILNLLKKYYDNKN